MVATGSVAVADSLKLLCIMFCMIRQSDNQLAIHTSCEPVGRSSIVNIRFSLFVYPHLLSVMVSDDVRVIH